MVDQDSASPQLPGVTYYGIEASHSGMCKFDSANAPGFRNVSTAIRDWVHEAPEVVAVRWQIEDEEVRARAGAEINERMRPFVNSPTAPSGTSRLQNSSSSSRPGYNSSRPALSMGGSATSDEHLVFEDFEEADDHGQAEAVRNR